MGIRKYIIMQMEDYSYIRKVEVKKRQFPELGSGFIEDVDIFFRKEQSNDTTMPEILSERFDLDAPASYINYTVFPPSDPHEILQTKADLVVSEYEVEPIYNYYAKQYESEISLLQEIEIPNYYLNLDNGVLSPSSDMKHFGNKKITSNLFKQLKSRHEANLAGNFLPTNNTLINKTKNIIFMDPMPDGNHPSFDEYPFGIKIKFSCFMRNTTVKDKLKNLGLVDGIIRAYQIAAKENIQANIYSLRTNLASVETETRNLKTIDLIQYVNTNSIITGYFDEDMVVYGDHFKDSFYSSHLKTAMLNTFLQNMVKDNLIDFSQIVSEDENYSEVLFYKVEKHIGSSPSTPIQTFLVPSFANKASLLDTQVKYSGTYTYVISSVSLVIANEYSFTDIKPKASEDKVELQVINAPQVRLVELQVFSKTVTVSCPPPPRPEIEFYNKNDASNNINIRMTIPQITQYGEFVSIETADALQLSKMKLLENNLKYDYKFKYYSGKISYDVYRLQSPPSSYADFQGKKYLEQVPPDILISKMLIDQVAANKKYYYMFRAVNEHGTKSNPSTIYEVELIKDADSSKVNVVSYKFPKDTLTRRVINMKRLFQIIPASKHTIFERTSDFSDAYGPSYKQSLDDVTLGIAQKPIWGKKFKIRVTSNDTGRKVDINVNFNLIKEKGNEEEMLNGVFR